MSEIITDGPKATVKLTEDVTATTEKGIRQSLKELLSGGVTEVIVDLAAVRIVDSVGIGLFISAHNSLRKIGGALVLINTSKDLVDLFTNMRLNQHFTITPA
jgi:anti-anti-sigma factor